jgi:predicted O-linked N-acetylglucosamine transferase (SPINDLY family)
MTDRMRRAFDSWREVAEYSDDELADIVRRDQVDVLVDLAGHTEGGRLLVLARKPAPIQVAWIGYPGTTGLAAIDFLVADRQQVPEADEPYYCERILPIDGGYVAYTPPDEAPPVGPLPAASGHPFTFGCFNNSVKLSPPLVQQWAEILRRQPGSRLLLKYGRMNDPVVEDRLRGLFAQHAVDDARLEFLGNTGRAEHLAAYGRVDVALDPFPYSGGLTTCEALWMGVPVITCPGATFAGRHALSHLTAAGLSQFVARDHHHYVELALELSADLERLAGLRAELRPRVAASPLGDARRVAEQLGRHLRQAWRAWCNRQPAASGDSP